jgi:hypothetical protein
MDDSTLIPCRGYMGTHLPWPQVKDWPVKVCKPQTAILRGHKDSSTGTDYLRQRHNRAVISNYFLGRTWEFPSNYHRHTKAWSRVFHGWRQEALAQCMYASSVTRSSPEHGLLHWATIRRWEHLLLQSPTSAKLDTCAYATQPWSLLSRPTKTTRKWYALWWSLRPYGHGSSSRARWAPLAARHGVPDGEGLGCHTLIPKKNMAMATVQHIVLDVVVRNKCNEFRGGDEERLGLFLHPVGVRGPGTNEA